MAEKNALIVATVGGFVPQFEMNNVEILREYGFRVHYAANFDDPVYRVEEAELTGRGMVLHQLFLQKSPFEFKQNWSVARLEERFAKEETMA